MLGEALAGSASAAVVRPGKQPLVTDGPFAETKEALGGFYVVECASREEALELPTAYRRALARSSRCLRLLTCRRRTIQRRDPPIEGGVENEALPKIDALPIELGAASSLASPQLRPTRSGGIKGSRESTFVRRRRDCSLMTGRC